MAFNIYPLPERGGVLGLGVEGLGLGVGLEVGRGVGRAVGRGVGLGVGLVVGRGVGVRVGVGVGLDVGVRVGLVVGVRTGAGVGLDVGVDGLPGERGAAPFPLTVPAGPSVSFPLLPLIPPGVVTGAPGAKGFLVC